jgi:hypothetical protein
MQVGVVTLINAAVQVPCAIVLGHRFGLRGIAAAGLLSTLLTTLPAGIQLLRWSTTVTLRDFVAGSVAPWLIRVVPLAALAAIVGVFHASVGVGLAALASGAIGLTYLWQMRPLYHVLPLDPRWMARLVSLRLMPPQLPPTAPMEQS